MSILATRHKGSAHTVVIIVLIVALIAVLGFVFWQNFMTPKQSNNLQPAKSSSKTPAKSEAEPKVEYLKKRSRPDLPPSVEVTYPSTWKLDTKKFDTDVIKSESTMLISPSGYVHVLYSENNNGGRGGACNETGKITKFSYEALNGVSGAHYIDDYQVDSKNALGGSLIGYGEEIGEFEIIAVNTTGDPMNLGDTVCTKQVMYSINVANSSNDSLHYIEDMALVVNPTHKNDEVVKKEIEQGKAILKSVTTS